MNYKKPMLLPILTWIHTLLLFAFLYPFIACVLLQKGNAFVRMSLCGLLLIFPILSGSLLLTRTRHLFVYLICGLVCSAIPAGLAYLIVGGHTFSASVSYWMTFWGGLLVFSIHAIGRIRYGNMKREFFAVHPDESEFSIPGPELDSFLTAPSYYHLFWFTIWYAIAMFLHFTTCLYIMFTIVLIDVFVIVGHHYYNALYEYVCQNQRVANLPLQTMRNIHRIIGILGAFVLVIALLPSILFGHEFNIQLRQAEAVDSTEFQQQLNSEMATGGGGNPFEELAPDPIFEPPEWLVTLCKILGYLILVGIAFFILMKIIRNLRQHGKDFAVEQEDEIIFLKPAESEYKESVFKRLRSGHTLSVNQQIRRRYRNTIRKATKGQPSNWATPSELEQAASLPDDEATAHLHDCYEKARYSRDGCSPPASQSKVLPFCLYAKLHKKITGPFPGDL